MNGTPAIWKTVSVFISSTFRDMQAERDHLVRFVFPRLREELLGKRIHFIDVDLRWGVTSEQDSLAVCREIIDECRPRFLCMLGGRYGWIPPGKSRSITAEEVFYGVLDRAESHRGLTYFYFRDEATTASMVENIPGEYREPEGSFKKDRLNDLKQAIENAGLQPVDYTGKWDINSRRLTDLKNFGDRVYNDLLAGMKSDPDLQDRFPTDAALQFDEFETDNAAMEAFVEERCDRFVLGSRADVMKDLIKHIDATDDEGYICLTGNSGSGKSALLAHLSRHLTLYPRPSTKVISHFVGASPGSTDIRRTLRRLCHKLKVDYPEITDGVPDDIHELSVTFKNFLNISCSNRRVVIILDAINQFDRSARDTGMRWLPEDIPPNLRIIVSAIDGSVLNESHRRMRNARKIELPPLIETDVHKIIGLFSDRYHKHFEPDQCLSLLEKSDADTPLYLLTALEELRTLGTYEEITKRIARLPDTINNLFEWILDRLEHDDGFRDESGKPVGHELVPRFSRLVGASRHGLSYRELADILAPGIEDGDPSVKRDALGNVAALLHLLRPYLMRRGELFDFYHSQFRNAVNDSYLSRRNEGIEAHKSLEAYFLRIADPASDRSWKAPESGQIDMTYDHALRNVVFHSYKAARLTHDPSTLYELVDDQKLHRRSFEYYSSPEPSIEYLGNALQVTVEMQDAVQLVHFSMERAGFAGDLLRSYLYRLPVLISSKEGNQELARSLVRLIPDPAGRRLGLILPAWMLRNDPTQMHLVEELIFEALHTTVPADLYQSAILMEMTCGLCRDGFDEAVRIIDLVPSSPVLQSYKMAWNNTGGIEKMLADRMENTTISDMSVEEEVLLEYQHIRDFVHRISTGFKPGPYDRKWGKNFENQLFERFGPSGVEGAYYLMASDQIQSGNDGNAAILITRGIFTGTQVPWPVLRTIAATVEVFGKRGEHDIAGDQEDRFRTLSQGARKLARTSQELAVLEDTLNEITIATDRLVGSYRPPGAREIFQHTVMNRGYDSDTTVTGDGDPHVLLSRVRLLVAENDFSLPKTLLPKIIDLADTSLYNRYIGLILAAFSLARICEDTDTMRKCREILEAEDVNPDALFYLVPASSQEVGKMNGDMTIDTATFGLSKEILHTIDMITLADTRCIAAVAFALRNFKQSRVLMELLKRVSIEGLSMSNLDPVLSELVRLPDLSTTDLRRMTDEIIHAGKQLTIPSGLGWYYYPGIMMMSGWSGLMMMAIGFSGALQNHSSFLLAGIFLSASALGGLTDLWFWKKTILWERPEKSRRLNAELGSIIVFWLAIWLASSLFPVATNHRLTTGLSMLGGLVGDTLLVVGLSRRGLIFRPWKTNTMIAGTVVAIIVSIISGFLLRLPVTGNTAAYFLEGLFLAGALIFGLALNILPKHRACVRRLGKHPPSRTDD